MNASFLETEILKKSGKNFYSCTFPKAVNQKTE